MIDPEALPQCEDFVVECDGRRPDAALGIGLGDALPMRCFCRRSEQRAQCSADRGIRGLATSSACYDLGSGYCPPRGCAFLRRSQVAR